mgnify:CR=1 FL=1
MILCQTLLRIFTTETSSHRKSAQHSAPNLKENWARFHKLTDEEKELFIKYASQSSEFLCVSNADSFIAGFRLGARFTYDTFVVNSKGGV